MRSRKAGRNGRGGLYAGHDNNIGKRGYLVMVSIVLSAILDIVWGYRVIVSRVLDMCFLKMAAVNVKNQILYHRFIYR